MLSLTDLLHQLVVRQHLPHSLTLGFRERTSALHFSGLKIVLLIRNHSHRQHNKFLIENMFDNSWISIGKIQLIIISIVRQLASLMK